MNYVGQRDYINSKIKTIFFANMHNKKQINNFQDIMFAELFAIRKLYSFSDKKIEKTVIVFLTDGVDARLYGTKTVEQKWFQSLMASVENSAGRSSITIHAVGFSKGM